MRRNKIATSTAHPPIPKNSRHHERRSAPSCGAALALGVSYALRLLGDRLVAVSRRWWGLYGRYALQGGGEEVILAL